MNSDPILKQFSRLLRPILYGKIYYHPSNIHYDNLSDVNLKEVEPVVRFHRNTGRLKQCEIDLKVSVPEGVRLIVELDEDGLPTNMTKTEKQSFRKLRETIPLKMQNRPHVCDRLNDSVTTN